MARFGGFFDSPIPDSPSEESQRMLRQARHTRKFARLLRPKGIRLRLARKLGSFIVPRWPVEAGTDVREVTYGKSGLMVTGEGADSARGVLLWIHGGGLVFGAPESERWLAGRYSVRTGMPAFLPRYRLAPEYPFPAAVDDVLAAYRGLLTVGFPAERIRLCGGSAGGYLALVLLGDIARAGLSMPASVLLQSPSVDISVARRRDAEHPDPLYPPKNFDWLLEAYAPGGSLDHPRLTVLPAINDDWPPILVQTGGTECIVADAELLGAALGKHRCEIQIWPGQLHGWVLLSAGRNLPEAELAFEYGARFLAEV